MQATYTFVTENTKLGDPLPGRGTVWVANGEEERIAEIGSYGPLVGRKVRSFPRTLVSVRDLVDRFGSVYFDDKGVHVISPLTNTGEYMSTTIGLPTQSRLYSFDLDKLVEHSRSLSQGSKRAHSADFALQRTRPRQYGGA